MLKITSENEQLTLLDVISILSFLIGLENLDMNITQEDMQKSAGQLDAVLREKVEEIHAHLEEQDRKIDEILRRLSHEESTQANQRD